MNWIYYVDIFGTCVFTISGVLTAIHKRFDLVGTLIIGFVTAIGGGSLRDMLLGRFPVGWMNDRNYFIAIIIGYVVAYAFKKHVIKFKRSMFLFDTIGIGLFTVLGINTALDFGMNVEICLLMGVMSACFGGIIRDVFTNEIPLIFRKEIYASACLAGGVVYLVLAHTLPYENFNIVASIVTVILIRYLAIRHHWTLNFRQLPHDDAANNN